MKQHFNCEIKYSTRNRSLQILFLVLAKCLKQRRSTTRPIYTHKLDVTVADQLFSLYPAHPGTAEQRLCSPHLWRNLLSLFILPFPFLQYGCTDVHDFSSSQQTQKVQADKQNGSKCIAQIRARQTKAMQQERIYEVFRLFTETYCPFQCHISCLTYPATLTPLTLVP